MGVQGHRARVATVATAARARTDDDDGGSLTTTPAAPLPLPGVAAKAGLVVGRADDPAESHADRLAEAALARLHGSDGQPSLAHGSGEQVRRIATPQALPGAVVGSAGGRLGEDLAGRVDSALGGGTQLRPLERSRMESAFGRPLGHVRIHRDAAAGRLSTAMSAEAFTVGPDIFLGPRAAGAPSDLVLAHEIAHVVTESGGPHQRDVRRLFGKVFGKAEPSDDEKRAQQEKKGLKQKSKDEERSRKRAVKSSKTREKTEKSALAASRKRGKQGRAELEDEIYDVEDPAGDPGAKMTAVNKRFEAALDYELGLFKTLMLNPRRGRGQKPVSEEEAAERAYHETWFVRFKDLESVRPPRETAAERLVIQVRRVRTEGAVQQQKLDDDTATDKAAIKLRMLGKDIEVTYERMAVLRDDLIAKDPTLHPALAQDQAAETVRRGLDEKLAERMPPKDGPLDMAAWAQATERVAAKQRQAQRDRAAIQSSLALLPDDQRSAKQQELDGTLASYEKQKTSTLTDAESAVGDIKTYGQPALKGISGIGGGIAGLVGKPQDKQLRKEQGVEKTSYGTVLPAQLDQGISKAVHDSRQAEDWQSKGLVSGPKALPTSTATQVKTGFGEVTSILTSLLAAVDSALSLARSTKAAWETNDAYEGLKATKAGAAGLDGLVAGAKHTANLAKLIDSGVAAGVKQVVPGLDIVTAVLGIVRATTDVASTAMRQRETDLSMFEARTRTTTKVYVTVYPLMKVSQVYTKQLENACWTLGSGIGDLVLSISQVATGGGYGIPLAIKSGKAVLDNLHKLGHYIADNVLAVMAKSAQEASEILHLEGGAEDELSKHPKMAVDGLVIRAAQGDPVALAFLSHYRIDGKPITAAYVKQIKPSSIRPGASSDEGTEGSQSHLLAQIRTAVLGSMNTSEDPKTAYDEVMEYVDKAAGAKKKLGEVSTTWKDTKALAQQRNDLAKQGRLGANATTSRGLGWRVRMFLSSEKREKLVERTKAYEDAVPLPNGIVCIVGDRVLGRHVSDSDLDAWTGRLTLADLEAELARKPRRNPPQAIELIRDLIRLKTTNATGRP